MVKPIIDKRRQRAAKKHRLKPKPCWVEAFLILLLHKAGGTLTVSLKSLAKFEKLKENNRTLMSYDPDNELITIRAPEIKLPENLVLPEKKIITEIN